MHTKLPEFIHEDEGRARLNGRPNRRDPRAGVLEVGQDAVASDRAIESAVRSWLSGGHRAHRVLGHPQGAGDDAHGLIKGVSRIRPGTKTPRGDHTSCIRLRKR